MVDKPTVRNPFAGWSNVWNWAQHKAAGYQGGSDYNYPKDKPVTSPCDGWFTTVGDGLNGVRVTAADGKQHVIRENKSIVNTKARQVKLGETIAISCRVNGAKRMYEHIETWVNGIRGPFEPHIYEAPVVTVGPKQRQAKPSGVFGRTLPNSKSAQVAGQGVGPNEVQSMVGWVKGELVSGIDTWFINIIYDAQNIATRVHYWAGGFTDSGTHDLKNMNHSTVTFDTLDENVTVPPQFVYIGDLATEPDPAPEREGFTFLNWTHGGGTPYDFATPVTADLLLTANWALIPPVGGNAPTAEQNADAVEKRLKPYFDEQTRQNAEILAAINAPKTFTIGLTGEAKPKEGE